jgi:predicted homoserine dehydrogenase-like protein
MIIVDRALRERAAQGNPIRVGMIGCGFMGRGVVNQIANSVPGMEIVAIANRTRDKVVQALDDAGVTARTDVTSADQVDDAILVGQVAVTDDPSAVIGAERIDAILDVTGQLEFGAVVTAAAIESGKHVVSMNVELDATVGPILKRRADAAGVVLTGCDGDQPGVQMNLVRFVRSIGLTPRVVGNVKGLQDPYRTPTTQQAFAERWGQNPWMVTSFADGTKISCEQAIVANAVGARVSRRGMNGFDHSGHIDELTERYDVDELESLGCIVDYVVGATPSPGVFCLATHDDPKQRHYLELYKLGRGPLYSFYTPYHLCHFEVPLTVARAVLFGDAAIQPLDRPRVEVITRAKTDLPAGTTLDALGGYLTFGECENVDVTASERLLPIGLAEGCHLRRDVPKDAYLTYDDVELPPGRFIDQLRKEQDASS